MTEKKNGQIDGYQLCQHPNGGSCINSLIGARDGKVYCTALIDTEFIKSDGTKYDCTFYK